MRSFLSVLTAGFFAVSGYAASTRATPGTQAQVVVTVLSDHRGEADPALERSDLTVLEGNQTLRVIGLDRLAGDLAAMQLFVLLDDSTRPSSLGVHLPELKAFLEALPATTQVSVGYMRNGTFPPGTEFTSDRKKALDALRPPLAIPGVNGSPYFALSELVKHWPSKEVTPRRAVLMLTDGVDPYYGNSFIDDPYVDAAIRDAQKAGVMIYSIYLRGAGPSGRSDYVTNFAQSRLEQVSNETGGHAYFQDLTDPVSIAPFLDNLQERLASQYRVTIEASNRRSQALKYRTELHGLKVEGPAHLYLP